MSENRYYVYVHTRGADGSIFYVGKGCGNRHLAKSNRSDVWKEFCGKDFISHVVASGLAEREAYEMEKSYITAIRGLGAPLVNRTIGGGRRSGSKCHKNRKMVYCSNGQIFDGICQAAYDLGISEKSVSRSARRGSGTSHGYSFSFDGFPDPPEVFGREATRLASMKKVYCSNGMVFDSLTDASAWVSENTKFKAVPSGISVAAHGRVSSCYGFAWSYTATPSIPDAMGKGSSARHKRRAVACSNGMVFESLTAAGIWVNGDRKSGDDISLCCRGFRDTAYGYTWRFA